MTIIVTKDNLNQMLQNADAAKRVHIIGRALVALFNRQTQAEQSANTTDNSNGIGFAGSDARSGCLTAKSYIKNRTLQQWQVDKWMTESRGYPRICKYAKQLNEIAVEKATKEKNALEARYSQLCQEYGMTVDSEDPVIIASIMDQMIAIESRLGNVPYRISGAVA